MYHGVQLTRVRALEVHGICIPGGAFEVRCDQGTSDCVYIIVLLFQSLIFVYNNSYFTLCVHITYIHSKFLCINFLCTCIHFAAKEIQIGIMSIYKHHALVRIPS